MKMVLVLVLPTFGLLVELVASMLPVFTRIRSLSRQALNMSCASSSAILNMAAVTMALKHHQVLLTLVVESPRRQGFMNTGSRQQCHQSMLASLELMTL